MIVTACATFKVVVGGIIVDDPSNLNADDLEVITNAALEAMTDKWEAEDIEVIEIEEYS